MKHNLILYDFEDFFLLKAQGWYYVDPVEGVSPNVDRFCIRRD
jgi:hypothetical protein